MSREMIEKLPMASHATRFIIRLLVFLPIRLLSLSIFIRIKNISGSNMVLSAWDPVNMSIMGKCGISTKRVLTKRQNPIIK